MSEAQKDPRGQLPLSPHVFEILLSLSRRPRHGYGIISEIRERSGGDVDIATSTLYASIRRMVRAGLIEDHGEHPRDPSVGPPRRYYRITRVGRQVLHLEADRVRRVARACDALLGDPSPIKGSER